MMKPAPKLVPSIFPRAVVRASILGDVMKNYGIPDDVIHIAQTGLVAGDFTGITFTGYAPGDQRPRERSTLSFDVLKDNDTMTLHVADGRSTVEAVSRKLAHAVAASVHLMRQQRLAIHYSFHVAENRNLAETNRKYGLTPVSPAEEEAQMRLLFRVSPGRDRGISFAHYTSA